MGCFILRYSLIMSVGPNHQYRWGTRILVVLIFLSLLISSFLARDNTMDDGLADALVDSGNASGGLHLLSSDGSFLHWFFPRDSVSITAGRGDEYGVFPSSGTWMRLLIAQTDRDRRNQAILVVRRNRIQSLLLPYQSGDDFSVVFFLTTLGQWGLMGYEAFQFLHGGLMDIDFALHLGPVLIRDGRINQAFSPRSSDRHMYAGVCLDTEGFIRIVAANTPVSLFALAYEMLMIGCDEAAVVVTNHGGWMDSEGGGVQSGAGGGRLELHHP
ncbi:MAG: hypothetical protein NZL83_00315 [Candidatus Absconditabacterales bacterium]|nr:hypothetical protein [Candidatus Absconditabacterales bacterium]